MTSSRVKVIEIDGWDGARHDVDFEFRSIGLASLYWYVIGADETPTAQMESSF
jgi:hypothetical protein